MPALPQENHDPLARPAGVFAEAWRVASWLVPVATVIAFVVLYFVAVALYPGGNRIDPASTRFSWVHNYWCDLSDATTYGRRSNPAQPVARAAMTILCAGLGVLWIATPRLFDGDRSDRRRRSLSSIVRIAGLGCALVTPWVGRGFHDLAVRSAGLLGAIAFVTTLLGLPAGRSAWLRWGGAVVLAVVAVNYFIWETRLWHPALALVQKFAFVAFLAWVVGLALRLRATR